MKGIIAVLSASVLAAACQPAVRPPEATAPVDTAIPEAWYRDASRSDAVYRIDAEASQLDVIVRRDGPLARLGHDHAIAVPQFDGFILAADHDERLWRADLRMDLRSVVVDSPAARTQARLDTNPSPRDIEATADNLHNKVLQTPEWRYATIRLGSCEALKNDEFSCMAMIGLKGVYHEQIIEFALEADSTRLLAEGQAFVLQSELGIEPFAVAGGTLRVADRLEVHFRIRATRL